MKLNEKKVGDVLESSYHSTFQARDLLVSDDITTLNVVSDNPFGQLFQAALMDRATSQSALRYFIGTEVKAAPRLVQTESDIHHIVDTDPIRRRRHGGRNPVR